MVVSKNVVLSSFPEALSLLDYALLLGPDADAVKAAFCTGPGEPNDFLELLEHSLVIPETSPPRIVVGEAVLQPVRNISGAEEDTNMKNILNRLIAQSVRNKVSYRNQNCLTLGYRARTDKSRGMRGNIDVECYFVNTIHALLTTNKWQHLAKRAGEAFMLHLLSRPVFIPSTNGCYLQVSGVSVSELLYQKQSQMNGKATNTRLFFSKKKDVNIALKKSQSPNDNALLKSDISLVQVNSRTQLPRFSLFYKHQYRKMNRLPIERLEVTEENLLISVFSQVTSLSSDASSSGLFLDDIKRSADATLLNYLYGLFTGILKDFRDKCDIKKALFRHCLSANLDKVPKKEKMVPNDFVDGAAKKKRRGTRAGVSNRNKVQRKTKSADNAQSKSSDKVAQGQAESIANDRGRNCSVISVGEKLLKRVIRSASNDQAFRDDGYETQDEIETSSIDFATLSPNSASRSIIDKVIPSSKRKSDTSPHSSGDRSEGFAFPYSFNSGENEAQGLHSSDSCRSSHRQSVKKQKKAVGISSKMNILDETVSVYSGLSASTENSQSAIRINIGRSHATQASTQSDLLRSSKEINAACTKSITDDYLSLATSSDKVSNFIKSVCRCTFTIETVWGSRHNLNCILSAIDSYILLGRNETRSIGQICSKIRISDIKWLSNGKITKHEQYALLYAFVYWIFTEIIHPLLCSNFYVTEAEGRGMEVLYYEKESWSKLVSEGFRQVSKHFVKIVPLSEVQGRFNESSFSTRFRPLSSNPANVRFMPKKSSVRAITNLRSSRPIKGTHSTNWTSLDSGSITNGSLYNCLHVLKRVYAGNPSLIGFGCFGLDEIYEKFKSYKRLLVANCANTESSLAESTINSSDSNTTRDGCKFYVAVLDLEKCYDNVDTVQLYDLVKNLLEGEGEADESEIFVDCDAKNVPSPFTPGDDGCLLHKYGVSHHIASMERAITKSVRHVSTGGDLFPFDEASKEISRHYRNSIISDGVIYPKLTNKEILRLLKIHLFNHVVKMPDDLLNVDVSSNVGHKNDCQYTQIRGIPQGSVLSPLLCNFYYGNAEKEIFFNKKEFDILGLHKNSVIVRLMDDYIMISTEKSPVLHFLQRAHQSLQPYGGGVNPLKTRVNFDASVEVNGKRINLVKINEKYMPWCGLLIDTESLQIRPSMQRILSRPLRFSTSIECNHVGLSIRRVMKGFVRMKCHALVLDAQLNSYDTVFQTVYEIFLVAAMRTHACIKHILNISQNESFFENCIVEAVFFGARLIHSRTSHRSLRVLHFGDEDYDIDGCDGADTSDTCLGNHKVSNDQTSDESVCEVTHQQAIWLGFLAFHTAMNKRFGIYNKVIHTIRHKMLILEKSMKKDYKNNDKFFGTKGSTILKDAEKLMITATWL